MIAKLAVERPVQRSIMSDMKPGDIAVILEHSEIPKYDGQIVVHVGHAIQSLSMRNCYWTGASPLPVRILNKGEQVILTQE
jgi:hypothetical protein